MTQPTDLPLDYLSYLDSESERFVSVLRDAPPGTSVPTCPDWDTEDLLWHLAEVQWFWGQIVARGITDGTEADALELVRPEGHEALVSLFETAARDLQYVLSTHPPEKPAWTWSDEQSVGFIRRRQAHEALIHRVDAEVAVNQHSPLDTGLCVDGIDEAFRVMYGGTPPWGSFSPAPQQTIRVSLNDADASWLVTMGTFTGTDPSSGKSYDEPDIGIVDADPGTEPSATIEGAAADVNCWLWHRPTQGPVRRKGNQEVLKAFESTIAPGIN